MKRLMIGDTFHPEHHNNNPYIVISTMKDGYIIKQDNDEPEEYSTIVIHDLFITNETPWTLKRKASPVFTSDNDELFRV